MEICNASLWKPKGLTGNVELNNGSYFCSGAESGRSVVGETDGDTGHR